jgi:acetyl-CoA C-acetyltransferase
MVEAAYEAYEDAGIGPNDIQAAWFGVTSSAISGQSVAQALKLDYIPVTRVENFCCSGTEAFRNACLAVASGVYDIALAIGMEKTKDTGWTGLGTATVAGSSQVELQVAPPVQFALSATRYAKHYNIPMEELRKTLARIAVKNHKNGSLNPKAHFQREISIEACIGAPLIAWPLGLFDCCGVSDGAACAVVTTPELAKSFKDDYVLVKGLGLAVSPGQGRLQSDYDFVHFEENVRAAKEAYAMAGITNPFKEIDHAVVHDCFTITELLTLEDLQFAPRGGASEMVHAGTFDLGGELAINTDGGLKCFGHPVGATGIRMVYEVCKQLQGKAGERQRKDPALGLTHNVGGYPGSQVSAVTILGKRD